MRILIIGGAGGIGAGMAAEAGQRYPDAEIHATFHRQPPPESVTNVTWHQLNAVDEQEVKALAGQFHQLDLLLNCVGVLHQDTRLPEKSINQFDPAFFSANLSINVLPSLLLARYFQTALGRSPLSRFVTVSAKVGSISDNRLGGWVSYRCSKAALNMALKTISIEWKRTRKNICVLSFHPGTTDTALSKPFQNRLPEGQLQTPERTAFYFFELLATLSAEDSGAFIDYAGNRLPW